MGCCFGKPTRKEEAVKKPLNLPPVFTKPAPEDEAVKKPQNSPPPVIRKPAPEDEAVKKPQNLPPPVIRKPAPEDEAVKKPQNLPPPVIRKPVPEEEVVKKPFNSLPPVIGKPVPEEEEIKKPPPPPVIRKHPAPSEGSHFSEEEVKKPNSNDDSSANSFLLPARELSITWGDDKRYWQWIRSGGVEIAELLEVGKFDVQGKFETRKLSQGTTYQVVFLVMLKKGASGFEDPVNLRLVFADGQKQERKEILMNLKKDEWIEVQVGEFYMPNKFGQIQFSMFQHSEQWKKGLAVKGVVIRQKK